MLALLRGSEALANAVQAGGSAVLTRAHFATDHSYLPDQASSLTMACDVRRREGTLYGLGYPLRKVHLGDPVLTHFEGIKSAQEWKADPTKELVTICRASRRNVRPGLRLNVGS
jgi:hypothetical protein